METLAAGIWKDISDQGFADVLVSRSPPVAWTSRNVIATTPLTDT